MKWLLLSIWLLLPLAGFSQQSQVLRIDQLPSDGVLLNQGWTFHPGDDPQWAAPAFDDRNWQDLDPAQDIMQLHELRKVGMGWFRLRLHLKTSLRQQALALLLTQTVASEIYLNGRPLRRLGKVSGDPNALRAAFASLVQAGLPSMEAIKAIISLAARLLVVDSTTRWHPAHHGYHLVVLSANPLEDIRALHGIKLVINNGKVAFTGSR
jgi:hypothetical protein